MKEQQQQRKNILKCQLSAIGEHLSVKEWNIAERFNSITCKKNERKNKQFLGMRKHKGKRWIFEYGIGL